MRIAFPGLRRVPRVEQTAFVQQCLSGDTEAIELVLEVLEHSDASGKFGEVVTRLRSKQQANDTVQPPAASTNDLSRTVDSADQVGVVTLRANSQLPRIPGHRLGNVLGAGGMGMVVEAFDEGFQIEVAIKLMKPNLVSTESARARFLSEARAVAKLRHPNIVGVLREGETDDGVLWFSMEKVIGQPLDKKVPKTGLDQREAATLVQQIALALDVSHRAGIFHRDIKPGNVLVDTDNQPRVVDFGLAKNVEANLDHTRDGGVVGTPHYMAPEQIASQHGEINATTDIYGLGGLLFYLLTGGPPFVAKTQFEQLQAVLETQPSSPREKRPDVDRDLAAICLKCLEKQQSDGYSIRHRAWPTI